MPAPPLTHHEILTLVEPFARSGRHVDLAASDRSERRLVFKPTDRGGNAPDSPALREGLQLECLGTGTFRLTRTLTRADGLQATVQTLGPQPQALLARIDGVPPQDQFRSGPGYAVARSYGFEPVGGFDEAGCAAVQRVLVRGVVQVDGGLSLTMNVPAVRGLAADITLVATPGGELDLPEDLLAVVGWDWTRLVRNTASWTSRLRLRGRPLRRSRTAEHALETVAAHLARVLAEAPARFHERLAWARWGVVFRRSIPSLTAIGLLVAVVVLPRLSIEQRPGLWMALHYVPIAVLAASFCLQELPRFEIPPWPRRSTAPGWRRALSTAGPGVPQVGES